MGLRIVVPGVKFSGPYLNPVDPVMPKTGALVLLEPGHPYAPWSGLFPANPDSIPNLAKDSAAAMGATIGFTYGGSGLNATNRAERTSKGGIHLAHLGSDVTANSGLLLQSSDVTKYIQTKKPKIYISAWLRPTALRTAPANGGLVQTLTSSSSHFATFNKGGFTGVAGTYTSRGYKFGDAGYIQAGMPAAQLLPSFVDSYVDAAALLADKPTEPFMNAANTAFYPMMVGNVGYQDSAVKGDQGSQVYYRVYVEDLTVSGRTYAQARNLDLAEYTKQVLTPGGRYYGDTFTAPATLLA